MARNKRSAEFVATLVYADEPQVIHLMSRTVPVVAVAIPSENEDEALFIAATASQSDWQNYLDGAADLRYLFTYAKARLIYQLDLSQAKGKRVIMAPFEGDVPEELLPPHRFFSSSHTEDFEQFAAPAQSEELLVDGEWELQEFGRFYQRYSDVYAFLVAQMNWLDLTVGEPVKAGIRRAFEGRPFRGGSSYLHLFYDLFDALRREERIGLEKVEYASPGFVEINGRQQAFEQIAISVNNFLDNHAKLREEYVLLHRYLSKAKLLRVPGDQFSQNDPHSGTIEKQARDFAGKLPPLDFEAVLQLSKGNVLVAAKVVLSFYRRLDEASSYFAQGRVSFDD